LPRIKAPVLLSVVPLVCALSVFPQADGTSARKDNLYSRALSASIGEMEKSWGHIDDGNHGSRIRTDYGHMMVERDSEITDDLPSEFRDHHVEYLDRQTMISRYESNGKEFSILKIHPLRSDGRRLKIQVSLSWVKYEKRKLVFALSDWSDVEFSYDCEAQNFIISAVKLGGI
jgi:hypothetical protein